MQNSLLEVQYYDTSYYFIVNEDNVRDILELVNKGMDSSLADYDKLAKRVSWDDYDELLESDSYTYSIVADLVDAEATIFSTSGTILHQYEIPSTRLTKAEKEKILRNEQEDKSFSEMINRYKQGKMKDHEVIKLGTTPYCYRLVGAKAIPLILPQSVLKNSLAKRSEELSGRNRKKHTSPHGTDIALEHIVNLSTAIRCPMMICKGSIKGTLVAILDLKDNNQHIYVSLSLDEKGKHNKITTVLGRKNLNAWIEKQIANNTILAMNKKVAEPKHTDTRVHPSKSLAIICYDDSIAYTTANVKYPEENNLQKQEEAIIEEQLHQYEIPSSAEIEFISEKQHLKVSKEAQYIINRNEKEDYLFSRQIDNFTDPNYIFPIHRVIRVCSTPNILIILGSKSESVLINQSVLKNSIQGMGNKTKKHTETHDIEKSVFASLSSEIRTPVLVMKGNKRDQNSIILIIEAKNKDDKNIFIPVKIAQKGDTYQNIITSVYGKDNLYNYISLHSNNIIAINTEKAGKLFADIGYQLSKSELDSAIRFDDSIAYTTANVKYPEENNLQKQEEAIMEEQNVNKEILEELKALREQVSRLEQRAEASEQKLDAISAFIAASNEAQSFEKTMHIAEKVTEQITGCEKAEFYALDADKRFFTTDGDKREYQSADSKTNALMRAVESKTLSIEDLRMAFIPVVSKENQAIGVIVAEKADGFDGVDFTQFGKDKAIMSQIDLAVKKELTHQEAITDKLTGLKTAQGLEEYVNANSDKSVTVMIVTAELPKQDPESTIKDVAKAVDNKGRSNINDNVYALGGGKFVSVMSCNEKKAKSIADMMSMSVKGIAVEVKSLSPAELSEIAAGTAEKAKGPTYFNREAYSKIDNKVYINGCSTKTAAAIAKMAQEADIQFSIKYDGDKSVVTLDGDKKDFYATALDYAKSQHSDHTVDKKTATMQSWGEKAVEKNVRSKKIDEQNKSAPATPGSGNSGDLR